MITVKKIGSRLVFKDDVNVCYYDFNGNKFIKVVNDKEIELKNAPKMLHGIHFGGYTIMNQIVFEDKNYGEFVKYVNRNTSCRTLAGTLGKLKKFPIAEEFFAAGLKLSSNTPEQWIVRPSRMNSKFMKFMKDNDIEFTRQAFESCTSDDFVESVMVAKRLMESENAVGNHTLFQLALMVRDLSVRFRYNKESLVRYLQRLVETEGFRTSSAITTLRDYANMAQSIGNGSFEKYPSNLLTVHQIVTRNYNINRDVYLSKQFETVVKTYSDLIYRTAGYKFMIPFKAEDLVMEGNALNHCVASYIQRVINGTSKIVFMRVDESESLVTIEVCGNDIVQAKGQSNRSITDEERIAITSWAISKKLNVRI